MEFFCMVNGTPNNVPISQMKFHVLGDECAIAGTWVDGKPYTPNKAAFRAALPYRWRKAFDRACEGLAFWHDYAPGSGKPGKSQINLSDRRGKYLATVYCVPANKES